MKRWLVLALGIGLAVAAAHSLLTARGPEQVSAQTDRAEHDSRSARESEPAEAPPAHATIGEGSRRELEAILRGVDGEGDRD